MNELRLRSSWAPGWLVVQDGAGLVASRQPTAHDDTNQDRDDR
jgi:hypothetical protein